MRLKEIMTQQVEVISPESNLREAAEKMRLYDIGALPVYDQGRPIGILTDRDIVVRAVAAGLDPVHIQAAEVMSQGVLTCSEEADIKDAAKIMETRQIRRLLVVGDNNSPVGIVSLGDLAVRTGKEKLAGEIVEQVSSPGKKSQAA